VPRQRTARLPVLSQSVPRPDGSRTRTGGPVKARIVALALVLVSLALVTMYLRESSDGALHGAQRIAVSVLTPFQVAAERVARPFRDAYGWSADLFAAKGENERLREEVQALRRQAIENETAAQENEQLRKLLDFREGPRFPADFDPVVTRILVRPQTVFRQDVVVGAGSSDGIRVDDPVITDRGLVGTVTDVTPNAAKVRLLTDQQAAASAFVLETNAAGIVVDGPSSSNTLVLDRVPKTERVENGNVVVTAGYRSGRYESLFPRGIPIGVVTSVSQRHIDPYKQIQVTPLVDFESLDEVIVLAEKGRRQ
jgi:rod shape-determining protein MreC